MKVTGLYLDGFRNYIKANVSFCDGINVITGQNAQGKTNLIEAIYYLATGKTFRPGKDRDLIGFNRENACIRADIFSSDRNQTLEAQLFSAKKRQIFINNIKLKKPAELVGKLPVVLFCPDDLCLIKEGAAIRRKLMDNAISQLKPGYAKALSDFNRLYDHKTRILKDHFEKPSLIELLDDFNLRLAEQSAQLIYYRAAFSKALEKRALDIHSQFTEGKESLSIKYKTVGGINPHGKKPSELMPALLEHQRDHRQAELHSGQCLSGAHKDDLEIEINGRSAKKYASQGQARTASVSIKLAERDIHCNNIGEPPVLLLDDVLSELDCIRQNYVLNKISDGQVFITCCEEKENIEYPCGKVIKIKDGNIL